MTKLNLFLRNIINPALKPNHPQKKIQYKTFALYIFLIIFIFSGCDYTPKKVSYPKENFLKSFLELCQKESGLKPKTRLVGKTLWVYLPLSLEDLKKFNMKFNTKERISFYEFETVQSNFKADKSIYINHNIRPIEKNVTRGPVPESIVALRKFYQVVQRLVINTDTPIDFYCIVIAFIDDIDNPTESIETCFVEDLKKYYVGILPPLEYSLRVVEESYKDAGILGDEEGSHLNYRDITIQEFVIKQIQHRINKTFKDAEKYLPNIDDKILVIAKEVIKIYNFSDITGIEINNLDSGKRLFLGKKTLEDIK